MKKIYMDHAATTPVDPKVAEAMKPYFTEKFGNASSLHQFGAEAKEALDKARESIAKKLNAEPNEIIFTSGGTESDNLAIMGVALANRKKGNHIITSVIEHPAVMETCHVLEKEGFSVTYVPVDKGGVVNPKDVEKAITKNTILVTIMHANNEIGTIQDIEAIGRICKDKEVLFHTDAAQSFCKVPIDVKKTNIDMISIASHKIHGPKGIGALFVKKGTKIVKQIYGGHQECDLRPGTENISGIVGFAKAVELYDEKDIKHMKKLRDKLIKGLLAIEGTRLNGSENRLCNNVNISFMYIEGEAILLRLDAEGIAVSTGSACSSQSLKPSHVLTSIGLSPEIAHGSIRLSLGRANTEKEIEYTIKTVKKVVKQLRDISPFKKDSKWW